MLRYIVNTSVMGTLKRMHPESGFLKPKSSFYHSTNVHTPKMQTLFYLKTSEVKRTSPFVS